MIPLRIVARLDIKGVNVIKGVHLEGLRKVGDPHLMATRYFNDGVDEILFMDVVASLYNRNQILSVVEAAAHDVFIPLTVGGGVRSLDDFAAILRSGADKISINTAAVNSPAIVDQASAAFGSQCVVVSVEVMRRSPGQWEVMTDNGRERTGRDALAWVAEVERRGAGEILLTSIDAEGTRKGFDIELTKKVRDAVTIPVIACGGAGSSAHIVELVERTGIDAVCCAAIFHYDLVPIPRLKDDLARAGIEVRR